jgi:hypothetical protein
MKKFIVIAAFLYLFSCKAQISIVPIQNKNEIEIQSNTYLNDGDGLLNPYVGTWVYTNGTDTLKFVLRKATNNYNGYYYEDVIYGEYQYIKEGVEIINTLSEIDVVYQAQSNHTIGGNTILGKNETTRCDDCDEDEKKVRVLISDPVKDTAGTIVLRRINVGNQPAISAFIVFSGIKTIGVFPNEEREYVSTTFKNGTYVLLKQP